MELAYIYVIIAAYKAVPVLFMVLGGVGAWAALQNRAPDAATPSRWRLFRAVEMLTGGVCLAGAFYPRELLFLVGGILFLHATFPFPGPARP